MARRLGLNIRSEGGVTKSLLDASVSPVATWQPMNVLANHCDDTHCVRCLHCSPLCLRLY